MMRGRIYRVSCAPMRGSGAATGGRHAEVGRSAVARQEPSGEREGAVAG